MHAFQHRRRPDTHCDLNDRVLRLASGAIVSSHSRSMPPGSPHYALNFQDARQGTLELARAQDKPTRASQEPAVSDAVLFVCWWQKDARRVPALGAFIRNQTRLMQHRRDTRDLRNVCLLAARTLLQLGTLAALVVGQGHTGGPFTACSLAFSALPVSATRLLALGCNRGRSTHMRARQ
jgi:hypothetical protein